MNGSVNLSINQSINQVVVVVVVVVVIIIITLRGVPGGATDRLSFPEALSHCAAI